MPFISAAIVGASLVSAPLAADDHSSDAATEIDGVSARPMSAEDFVTMPRLGGPTVTPYGRYAVYSVTETDPETYERAAKHYLLDLVQPGAQPIALNLGVDAYSLTFGADNFLYFLSNEHTDENAEKRARVWRVALEGNGNVTGPIPVADISGTDIAGFKVAPQNRVVGCCFTRVPKVWMRR